MIFEWKFSFYVPAGSEYLRSIWSLSDRKAASIVSNKDLSYALLFNNSICNLKYEEMTHSIFRIYDIGNTFTLESRIAIQSNVPKFQ